MPRYNPLSGCLWTPHEHNRKNHLNQLGSELSFKHQQTIQPQRANRSACLHRIAPSHQPAQSIRRLAHLLPTHRAAAFLLIRQPVFQHWLDCAGRTQPRPRLFRLGLPARMARQLPNFRPNARRRFDFCDVREARCPVYGLISGDSTPLPSSDSLFGFLAFYAELTRLQAIEFNGAIFADKQFNLNPAFATAVHACINQCPATVRAGLTSFVF